MKKEIYFFRLAVLLLALPLVFALFSCGGSRGRRDFDFLGDRTPDEDSKSKISDGTFNYSLYKTFAEVSGIGNDTVVIIRHRSKASADVDRQERFEYNDDNHRHNAGSLPTSAITASAAARISLR